MNTGIKDQNKVEIKLGDILRDSASGLIAEVKFGYCPQFQFTGWYVQNNKGFQDKLNGDRGGEINNNVQIVGNVKDNKLSDFPDQQNQKPLWGYNSDKSFRIK